MQSRAEIERICEQNILDRAEEYEESQLDPYEGLEVCGECWNCVDGVCKLYGDEVDGQQPACESFEE